MVCHTWLQEEYQVSGEELSKMVADGKVEVSAGTRARIKSWHEKLAYKS
jgi:hypothetical protein